MRAALAVLLALACACGDSSSSLPDAAGGGDDGGGDGSIDPTGDGGTTGAHTVKLTLTNRPMNAQPFSFFVAYQDGSAPWQPAPAPSGDTYSLPIHAPSYGVAYGCIGNVSGSTQLRTVTIAQFAVGERTELTLDVPARCSDRGGDTVTLSGTVENRAFGGVTVVQFGDRTAFVGNVSGNFTLQTPPGTHDLVVAHAISEGNGEFFVDETLVVRDVAVTGATSRTIDFSAAEPTQSFPVIVNINSTNVRVVASTTLYTANGTTLGTVRESQGWESIALADAQMRTSDVYDQAIALAVPGQGVTLTNATSTPGAQTFVPVPLLGMPSTSVPARMPYPILQTTWPAYDNSVGYAWSASQQPGWQQCGGNQSCTIAWTAYLSPGVTGATPGFRMPALADLPAWKPAFELVDNAQVVGSVTAVTSSAGAGDFPPGTPASGTRRAFVRGDFAVTP